MRSSRAGFTFAEVAMALGIGLGLVTSFGGTFRTSSELAQESRATLRAHEELHRSLDVIANEMRGAAAATLGGFGPSLDASAPSWKCVTGVDANGNPIYGPLKSLEWQAATGPAQPGRLMLTAGATTYALATRVPAGSFLASLQGNAAMLRLGIRYTTTDGVTVEAFAESLVSLRN